MPDSEDDIVFLPIEDHLDLHAFAPRDVASAVEAYLDEAHRLCLPLVRIVHGRGIGVQRAIVRSILAKTPFVKEFSDAPPESGGWGATVAALRRLPES